MNPAGRSVEIGIDCFDRPVLLAFLHIGCDGCDEYWRGFRDSDRAWPSSVSPVVVTRGPESVESEAVGRLAAGFDEVPLIMSEQAWTDYRVSSYPFFVLVDVGSRMVIGETVGFGWADVSAMVSSAGV